MSTVYPKYTIATFCSRSSALLLPSGLLDSTV